LEGSKAGGEQMAGVEAPMIAHQDPHRDNLEELLAIENSRAIVMVSDVGELRRRLAELQEETAALKARIASHGDK
jgi:uncharacterized small protein (DUF1192 family)